MVHTWDSFNNIYVSSPKYRPSLSKEEQEKLRKEFIDLLSAHLRAKREESGLTQEDLAFKAGLNTAYYSHLERGVYSPTFFVIWRIAQALGISLDEFMKGFED